MDTAPLTHHEILALVEPFARRGRRVDLAASDRVARRIAFRPIEHAAREAVPAHRETLSLAQQPDGGWQLVRTLEAVGDGPVARLQVSGTEPGVLLARVEAVDAAQQLVRGPGWVLAIEHRLDGTAPAPDEPAAMAASRGILHAGGLVMTMKVPTVSGISAEIAIVREGSTLVELPDDLLEVLGRGWARLDAGPSGWTSHTGLGGRGAARYRDAEARLRRAGTHLARTLSEPPARYAERLRAARWSVAARRSVPLVAVVALVAAAALFPSLGLSRESPVWMLIFNAPPLLLALFFSLREMPRITLPRPPRRVRDDAWRPLPIDSNSTPDEPR
ncbi:MAG: hypothetical protein NTW15_07940 [Burkholderiales bacterium]|nr:hypothetical protein [Burkholderiales bacterium]